MIEDEYTIQAAYEQAEAFIGSNPPERSEYLGTVKIPVSYGIGIETYMVWRGLKNGKYYKARESYILFARKMEAQIRERKMARR